MTSYRLLLVFYCKLTPNIICRKMTPSCQASEKVENVSPEEISGAIDIES